MDRYIKKVYYRLEWSERGDNFYAYKDFDTAEEADKFLQEELRTQGTFTVSKTYAITTGGRQ